MTTTSGVRTLSLNANKCLASMSQAVRYFLSVHIFMRWCLVLGVWCLVFSTDISHCGVLDCLFPFIFASIFRVLSFWTEQQNTRSYSLIHTRTRTHTTFVPHISLSIVAFCNPAVCQKRKKNPVPFQHSSALWFITGFGFFSPLHSPYIGPEHKCVYVRLGA